MLASLILSFYIRAAQLWAVQAGDGIWLVAGRSRKGGAEFQEAIREKCGELPEQRI